MYHCRVIGLLLICTFSVVKPQVSPPKGVANVSPHQMKENTALTDSGPSYLLLDVLIGATCVAIATALFVIVQMGIGEASDTPIESDSICKMPDTFSQTTYIV